MKLYLQKQKHDVKTTFTQVKMYGTNFNYKGFNLDAIQTKTPNACVPEYLLEFYHDNHNEPNRFKKYHN